MALLRSSRLEHLLGGTLESGGIGCEAIRRLVDGNIAESFDLDFKERHYGTSDRDKRELALDVAAIANGQGGVIIVGVAENEAGYANDAPGVDLADSQLNRINQIIAAAIAPLPRYELIRVPCTEDGTHGFLVLAVPSSPRAPHAVVVNESLRFPKRLHTTTSYLAEPEVAAFYADRFASRTERHARLEEIEEEGLEQLDLDRDGPWLSVSLVPGLPADLRITREIATSFDEMVRASPLPTVSGSRYPFRRSWVRQGALGASNVDGIESADQVVELHTDGAVFIALALPDLLRSRPAALRLPDNATPRPRQVDSEAVSVILISCLLGAGAFSRWAGGAGDATVRARLGPITAKRPLALISQRRAFPPEERDTRTAPLRPIQGLVDIDELADQRDGLLQAAGRIGTEMANAFGFAELRQISADGVLNVASWAADSSAEVELWLTHRPTDWLRSR